MKKFLTSLAIATLKALTIGASFASPKADCCNGGACPVLRTVVRRRSQLRFRLPPLRNRFPWPNGMAASRSVRFAEGGLLQWPLLRRRRLLPLAPQQAVGPIGRGASLA
jgi:hypothetical protein